MANWKRQFLSNPERAYDVLDQVHSILPGYSSNTGNTNYTIDIAIDPNIPITSDFGKAIGQGIADRMISNLSSRGHRV